MPTIRLLRPGDLAACMALKEEAGWNQTEQDWLQLFDAAPEGCFGVEADGSIVATTTAVCYGTKLAWIGMVLTAGHYRRQGLASALLRHTLDYLADKGVDGIKLDATEMGRPVYLRFGFEDECTVERWLRPGTPARLFQEQLRDLGASVARGRPGSKAAYFGPCRAATSADARMLLDWFLGLHSGEAIYWDILPDNRPAVELARERGFAPVRKLMRMARSGRPGAAHLPTDIEHTYAIAGFEWG